MNLDVLMNSYANDSRIFSIADRILLSEPQHIHLSGLHGSASQLIFSAVFNHPITSQLNHIVILRDAEEAAYFHNTIENITNALDIFYFPSSFKSKKNFHQLNNSHVMLRTEALTKLSKGANKKIIVTYPEALFEKVVLSKTLSQNIISFKQGETIKVDELLSRFVGHGFSRSDFVYEPGQFAVRGGILDIYSYGNEKPYRIELFGNEIDSIRLFDPETQLSERKLQQVNIIPNVEIDSGEKVSLLNFLPENTAVWTEDWEFIKEKIVQQEEDLELFLEVERQNRLQAASHKLKEEEHDELSAKTSVTENDFVKANVLEEQIKQRHVIELGNKSPSLQTNLQWQNYTKAPSRKEGEGGLNPSTLEEQSGNKETINLSSLFGGQGVFNTRPQPAFNRQFNLLIQNLKELEQKKYNIFLFADNPKQLERLHSIFSDLKAEIQFTPIPTSIHEGFIDDDLKLVCYTDHQI